MRYTAIKTPWGTIYARDVNPVLSNLAQCWPGVFFYVVQP